MKKFYFIFLVLLLLCFTGCSGNISSNHHINTNDSQDTKKEVKKDRNPIQKKAAVKPDHEENLLPKLSDAELSRALQTVNDYYRSIHREPLSMKQTQRNPRYDIYEDYDEAELICFEVSEESVAEKRYITLGSKDGWNSFEVLNEGY